MNRRGALRSESRQTSRPIAGYAPTAAVPASGSGRFAGSVAGSW